MQALTSFLGGLTELRFIHEDWSDEEVIAAASLLRFCPCVKQLTIGIEGLTKRGYGALGELFGASKHSSASLRLLSTDCISSLYNAGALPALEYLSVGQCVIGRDVVPLVEGLYPGISAETGNEMGLAGDVALPALKVLNFFGMVIEDAPLCALAHLLMAEGIPALEDLQIWTQKAGAEGVLAVVEQLRDGAARFLRFVDMSGETVKCVDRRSTKPPAAGLDYRPAGKGPTESMRRACDERGIEFCLSNATNYKI